MSFQTKAEHNTFECNSAPLSPSMLCPNQPDENFANNWSYLGTFTGYTDDASDDDGVYWSMDEYEEGKGETSPHSEKYNSHKSTKCEETSLVCSKCGGKYSQAIHCPVETQANNYSSGSGSQRSRTSTNSREVIFNTGADCHIFSYREWFNYLAPCNTSIDILGENVRVIGKGTVDLPILLAVGKVLTLHLENCWLTERAYNILSPIRLLKDSAVIAYNHFATADQKSELRLYLPNQHEAYLMKLYLGTSGAWCIPIKGQDGDERDPLLVER